MRAIASLLLSSAATISLGRKVRKCVFYYLKKPVFVGAVELVFEFSNFEFSVAIWEILEEFRD